MRILIDPFIFAETRMAPFEPGDEEKYFTNDFTRRLFADRKKPVFVPHDWQDLFTELRQFGHQLLLHPYSFELIKEGWGEEPQNFARSQMLLLKQLKLPSEIWNEAELMEELRIDKDDVWRVHYFSLVFSLRRDAVDFVISDRSDLALYSARLNVTERVLDPEEARFFFRSLNGITTTSLPAVFVPLPAVVPDQRHPIREAADPFWSKHKNILLEADREGRKGWLLSHGNEIEAGLLEEITGADQKIRRDLPATRRLHIPLLLSRTDDFKTCETIKRFIVERAIENHVDELTLTPTVPFGDFKNHLNERFGFKWIDEISGKKLYRKVIRPSKATEEEHPIDFSWRFFPSFRDEKPIRKLIVALPAREHDRLFPDYSLLDETNATTPTFGATDSITKVYLSHSLNNKIHQGDLLFFFRESAKGSFTVMGIVARVHKRLTDPDQIIRLAGRSNHYSRVEIETMVKQPAVLIKFWRLFNLKNLGADFLVQNKLSRGYPHSIFGLNHEKYLRLKKALEIDAAIFLAEK